MKEWKTGEKCLGWNMGKWQAGMYVRKGEKPGEHIMITEDLREIKIIKNEIQWLLD